MLLELPPDGMPPYTKQVLFELLLQGITPILSGVESNRELRAEPRWLYDLVRRGALVQLDAATLIREEGATRRWVGLLLTHGLVHLVGSNAHDPHRRPPRLRQAYGRLREWVGEARARELLEGPQAVWEGRELEVPDPVPLRRRSGTLERVLQWLGGSRG